MKLKTLLICGALALASTQLAACGKTVEPGNAGIKISTLINPGISTDSLPVGWHPTFVGERIVEYPTITRNYSFTQKGDGDKSESNEELIFADNSGLPMSADVQVTLSVNASKVSDVYKKYKLGFEDLLYGPVRAQIRTSIAAEASQVSAMDMFSSQRSVVMQKALVDVQKHFEGTGIEVSDLQWLGNLRAPQQVMVAIQQRTAVEQQTQVSIQKKQQAEAEAAAKIAEAEGDKKVRELNAEALNSAGGEKVLRQQWIESGQAIFLLLLLLEVDNPFNKFFSYLLKVNKCVRRPILIS
jgi:regulator of protease activity HflC (stomatin/prohibitin superfamily)